MLSSVCVFGIRCTVLVMLMTGVENGVVPVRVEENDLDGELDKWMGSPPLIDLEMGKMQISPFVVTHHISNKPDLANMDDTKGNKVEDETSEIMNGTKKHGREPNAVESWCVIWYLGAFGSLVCFFLIITCTELFFGNPLYRDNNLNAFVQNIVSGSSSKPRVPETPPPPPYHLFAPPDYYDSVQKTASDKRKPLEVFVVPVHSGGKHEVDSPPQYEEATRKIVDQKLNAIIVAGKSNFTVG